MSLAIIASGAWIAIALYAGLCRIADAIQARGGKP